MMRWWPFKSRVHAQQNKIARQDGIRSPIKRRRVHLGIDYGTSSSKMVLRDYGAPGGERAVVLSRNGSQRFSSSVALLDETLFFGSTPNEANFPISRTIWYHSIKMRVAAEVKDDAKRYCYGPLPELPPAVTSKDLAALTLWWLISEGRRVASDIVPDSEIALGMTLGVPMSFFTDPILRDSFLQIAKIGWSLFRLAGPLATPRVSLSTAKSLLREAYSSAADFQVPAERVRDWVRSEAEAAMWWAFQSPSVPAGTYAKIDVGAGTTNASVFRIMETYSNGRWVKSCLVFYGARSSPVGTDALDESLSRFKSSSPERCLEYRGFENDLLAEQGAVGFCMDVLDSIVLASRMPWKKLQQKLGGYVGRDPDWRKCRVFLIGGGSCISQLRRELAFYPFDLSVKLPIHDLDAPPDLQTMAGTVVGRDELPFVLVAHGLSQLGLAIPEVDTPDQVEALPPMRLKKLPDHEELYPV